MNEIKVFQNSQLGAIRTVMVDGDPWFVGKEVCALFGDTNHNRSLSRVDAADKVTCPIDTAGGTQLATLINESGLYALLFALQPQKANKGVSDAYPLETQERIDKLYAFKRWITHDVIPSIRKHGLYATTETVEAMLGDPDVMIQMLTTIKQERAERVRLETKVAQDAPKVLFADSVTASDTTILIGELSKVLKQNGFDVGQNRLFKILRGDGYLMQRLGCDYNVPTQKSMELGLFTIKETAITHADGRITVNKTPKVTGKGQVYFVNRYCCKEMRA